MRVLLGFRFPAEACFAADRLTLDELETVTEHVLNSSIVFWNDGLKQVLTGVPSKQKALMTDLLRKQPRILAADTPEFEITNPTTFSTLKKDPLFLSRSDFHHRPGEPKEPRDQFFERKLGFILKYSKSIEIYDRYFLTNLLNQASGEYWLLSRLSRHALQVTVHTTFQTSERRLLDLPTASRRALMRGEVNAALATLGEQGTRGFSATFELYNKGRTSETHDRFWKLTLDGGSLFSLVPAGFMCFAEPNLTGGETWKTLTSEEFRSKREAWNAAGNILFT